MIGGDDLLSIKFIYSTPKHDLYPVYYISYRSTKTSHSAIYDAILQLLCSKLFTSSPTIRIL